MAKRRGELPRTLCQTSAQHLLEENGWTRSLGGKHNVKMTKEGKRPITLPHHRGQDYGQGLRDAILTQAGLKGQAPEVDATKQTGTEARDEG
ncbi:MAG TPA: type II toxin-antitoxin system HicA family toxin [Mycobacteriales bacterium]|nr:type II toxin-antitoxin system HicA family toxin [Mycobacteriales bacterium]